MNISELKTYLGEAYVKAETMLAKSLASDIDLLNKTNRSLLDNGGKRLRMALGLLVARACSGGFYSDDSVRFAVASELLHNATLLHDDVADESSQRRGVPTVYSLLGGKNSVLLGDFWLVKAVGRILDADNNVLEVVKLFSKTLSNLAEGEMLQLQNAYHFPASIHTYYRIIYNKTASLFESDAIAAAVSVGASKVKKDAAKEFASNLGMAFQVKDDIMDYTLGGDKGKPSLQDIAEGKITLPLIGAAQNAPEEAVALFSSQLASYLDKRVQVSDIQSLAEKFVLDFKGMDYAESKVSEFTDKALIALKELPDTADRKKLAELTRFVGTRTF